MKRTAWCAASAVVVSVLALASCTSTSSHIASPSSADSVTPSEAATSVGSPAAVSSSVAVSSAAAAAAVSSSPTTSLPPTPEQLPHIATSTLTAFYDQTLAWHGCDGGFQCAALTVPVDYGDPAGRTIQLAVVRYRTSSKHRIGSVVLNPGGPGASGIAYAEEAAPTISSQLGGAFDVVSFDPRGVGDSAPVRCLSSAGLDQWVAFEADPRSAAQVAEQDQLAKTFAAGCETRSGALLAHVSTLDTARDLDVLRAALDDAKLTYIGASYGTFLGAIYAQLFPTNVRALVLDGALDPSASSNELDEVQTDGFEGALQSYIATCVKSSRCPLGTSAAAAEPLLDAWIAKVQATPIVASNGRTLTASLAVQGIAAALYSPASWPTLTSGLASAFAGNPGTLLALSDEIDGRQSDGSYNNLVESNAAINCADRPDLGVGMAAHAQAALAGEKQGPTFGEFIDWGNVACAEWPVAPEMSPGPVDAAGAPPILVIGTTRDPATPYRWAQALAKELGSPLLTYDGDGHTAFLRSTCVDAAVRAYVVGLATPAAGTVCR